MSEGPVRYPPWFRIHYPTHYCYDLLVKTGWIASMWPTRTKPRRVQWQWRGSVGQEIGTSGRPEESAKACATGTTVGCSSRTWPRSP